MSVVQDYTSKSEKSTGRPWFSISVHEAAKIKPSDDDSVKAIVLTGDDVEQFTVDNWNTILTELVILALLWGDVPFLYNDGVVSEASHAMS